MTKEGARVSNTQGKGRYADVTKYFDSVAGKWIEHTRSMREDEFNKRTISPIMDCIRILSDRKKKDPRTHSRKLYMLDAGCGAGYWTYEILNRACIDGLLQPFDAVEAWMLDISPQMLEQARTGLYYFKEEKEPIRFEYQRLIDQVEVERLEFKTANLDLRELDTIEHPHFDITFFHKVLSMLDYGKDAQASFSALSRNTDFLLTAVKSKKHYQHKMLDGMVKNPELIATCKEGYKEIQIPEKDTTLIVRQLDDFRFIVNDDARPGGKAFFEYTYGKEDLESLYEGNRFKILPSYKGLRFIGKPIVRMSPFIENSISLEQREEYYPLLQAVGVSESSPYAQLLSEQTGRPAGTIPRISGRTGSRKA